MLPYKNNTYFSKVNNKVMQSSLCSLPHSFGKLFISITFVFAGILFVHMRYCSTFFALTVVYNIMETPQLCTEYWWLHGEVSITLCPRSVILQVKALACAFHYICSLAYLPTNPPLKGFFELGSELRSNWQENTGW